AARVGYRDRGRHPPAASRPLAGVADAAGSAGVSGRRRPAPPRWLGGRLGDRSIAQGAQWALRTASAMSTASATARFNFPRPARQQAHSLVTSSTICCLASSEARRRIRSGPKPTTSVRLRRSRRPPRRSHLLVRLDSRSYRRAAPPGYTFI